MKKLNYVVFIALVAIILSSCNGSSSTADLTEGNWIKRATLNGSARAFGVSFVIGNFAYVGTGRNNNNADTMLTDFYKYDITKDSWTEINSIPKGRMMGVAFSIENNGYVGTGYDNKAHTALQDFYQYDPAADQWTAKANYPKPIYWATGFALGNKGYITCGMANDNSTYLKDLYSYDPSTNTWAQDVSSPGDKRLGGTAFVYNKEAYILGGTNSSGTLSTDFYKFNQQSDSWAPLRPIAAISDSSYDDNYSSITRTDGIAMVMGNDVFFTVGTQSEGMSNGLPSSGTPNNNTWHYDPTTDLWDQRSSFQAPGRDGAVGFVVSNRGIIGLGSNGSSYYDSFYEFDPTQDLNTNDWQ